MLRPVHRRRTTRRPPLSQNITFAVKKEARLRGVYVDRPIKNVQFGSQDFLFYYTSLKIKTRRGLKLY